MQGNAAAYRGVGKLEAKTLPPPGPIRPHHPRLRIPNVSTPPLTDVPIILFCAAPQAAETFGVPHVACQTLKSFVTSKAGDEEKGGDEEVAHPTTWQAYNQSCEHVSMPFRGCLRIWLLDGFVRP